MATIGKKPVTKIRVRSKIDHPDFVRIKDRLEEKVFNRLYGKEGLHPIAIRENSVGTVWTF